jgi:hypothetical protein
MRISGKTKVYGLIGDPVTHSLSPSFQNTAFEHLGLGYTTDGIGTLKALRYNGTDPFNKRIIILGVGGASRSVSLALAQEAKTLASGALAAGLSWTGPAVADVDPQEKVDRIMSHWEKFGGEIIEIRVNTKKACVVQDTS